MKKFSCDAYLCPNKAMYCAYHAPLVCGRLHVGSHAARESLQDSLDALEKTDPAVAKASRKYDETVRSIVGRVRPRPGSLEDEVLSIVHAFSDRGRKDIVRDLARRIGLLERSKDPHTNGECLDFGMSTFCDPCREFTGEWEKNNVNDPSTTPRKKRGAGKKKVAK